MSWKERKTVQMESVSPDHFLVRLRDTKDPGCRDKLNEAEGLVMSLQVCQLSFDDIDLSPVEIIAIINNHYGQMIGWLDRHLENLQTQNPRPIDPIKRYQRWRMLYVGFRTELDGVDPVEEPVVAMIHDHHERKTDRRQ